MLGQRRRRWPTIKPALGQHLVFAGYDCFIARLTFTDNKSVYKVENACNAALTIKVG